jgi:hypothetical protein
LCRRRGSELRLLADLGGSFLSLLSDIDGGILSLLLRLLSEFTNGLGGLCSGIGDRLLGLLCELGCLVEHRLRLMFALTDRIRGGS